MKIREGFVSWKLKRNSNSKQLKEYTLYTLTGNQGNLGIKPNINVKKLEMEISWIWSTICNIILLFKIVNSLVDIPKTLLPKKARDGIKFQRIYGRVNA